MSGEASALRFALRRLRRGWRSGELLILLLALLIAVSASGTVRLFAERVRLALNEGSSEALGADLVISSNKPLPERLRQSAQREQLRSAEVVQLSSVVFAAEVSSLASIKAASADYPLRGTLRLAALPYAPAQDAKAPPPGAAYVDARLWQDLQLRSGGEVAVGELKLRVAGVIENEPDRGNGFSDLAPRLMMNRADLDASGLLGPGSRADYRLYLAGAREAIARLVPAQPEHGLRYTQPQDARRELRGVVQRAGQLLDLAVLAAMLLAAAAVAQAARQYGEKQREEIALLKCLGASRAFITRALLLQLLLLGLAAGAGGALLAAAGQRALAALLQSSLQLALPPVSLQPLLGAVALGLLMLLGFAAPPLLSARNTPVLRVLQRAAESPGAQRLSLLLALATAALLLWLATGDAALALRVALGTALTLGVLALLAWLLVYALQPLRRGGRRGFALRFGLANLARRRGATVAQATGLGIGLLALLLVSVVREDLLDSWRNKLPADAPNQFLINIQPEQREALQVFFASHGLGTVKLWPMARGRLVALNGKPVDVESFDDPQTRAWINREFNLSWTDVIGSDNVVTQGQWWGEAGRGQRWLSAEEYAIERLHLKLGDTLTLDFSGETQTFTVHNFRKVDWGSFKPNFFLLAPEDAVDEAVPRQYIASFYLPAARRALLRELVAQFPNISVLDIDAALRQVRGLITQVLRALEFVLLFTLASGLALLLAAVEATRGQRQRETALLRTLGASRVQIVGALMAEYALLGLLAGAVAAIAAQSLAWLLAAQVLDIPYGPRPLLWLLGMLAGALLVMALGWLSLRGSLRSAPRQVLAG